MKNRKTPWGYAEHQNAEFWQGTTSRREAEDSARELTSEGGWIHEGAYPPVTRFVPSAEDIIERMNEMAADNGCPDEIDDPFNFRKGAEAALKKAILKWAAEYVDVNFWEPVGLPIRVEK